MAKLSTAAWLVHDLGLAASLGGTLFGRVALQPSLQRIALPEERDLVSADAWKRFSWINLASHAAFAVPWLVGRTMMSGAEAGCGARLLTRAKDVAVVVSLVSGVATVLLGRRLARRGIEGRGAQVVREERFALSDREIHRTSRLKKAVGILGLINMISLAKVGGLTTILAMKGNQSVRFAPRSRLLP